MKKLVVLCTLALGQLLLCGANLNLLYPVGGEMLPGNGTHTITWTNSDNMPINLYLDWYDTNGAPLITNNSIYATTLGVGTNTFIFSKPTDYPGFYKYKFHLVGSDSGTNIESSSDYVFVTDPASFTCTIENTNLWLPGQNRNIDVTWNGFQSGDTFDVVLEAPTLNLIGYGFLMTNMFMGSGNGSQVISIPYPSSNSVSAYPPLSFSPMNGTHSFTLSNKRCGIIQTFGAVDVLTSGLRMYLVPLVFTNVMRGDSISASKIFLDATLTTNAVLISSVKLVFTSYSTNWIAVGCNLIDGTNGTVSSKMLNFRPQDGSNYNTQVSFPVNLTLAQGEIRELNMVCSILGPSELANFIWNTENPDTNKLAGATAVYIDEKPVPVSVVKSSSAYLSIEELINPKFFGGGSGGMPLPAGGGSMNWDIMCKPNTSYLVQSSTNLVDWDDYFVTNPVTGTMNLFLTNENPHCFFRLKEN